MKEMRVTSLDARTRMGPCTTCGENLWVALVYGGRDFCQPACLRKYLRTHDLPRLARIPEQKGNCAYCGERKLASQMTYSAHGAYCDADHHLAHFRETQL